MSTRLTSAVTTLMLCGIAAPAFAQLEDDRYGPAIETLAEGAKRPAGTYVVIGGDTLWGLSEQVFGDGGFWPSLWSYNPQITNPHWIYPGDLLYLKQRAKLHTSAQVVYAKGRFTDEPRLEEVLARFKGFVTERQYKESGVIAASREEKTMLGEYDEAYLKFSIPKRILPGEEYTIYRPERTIKDPDTGKIIGRLIKHLGIARVLNVDRKKALIKSLILDSYEEIMRGDLLTKRVWTNELVVPVENRIGLWSKVLASFRGTTEHGEHDYVLVNRGFKQKLRRGNRLILRWRGDGSRNIPINSDAAKKFPWENHGEIMIVEPFENTSLAVVIRAIREVHKGDLLELVRGY